MLQLHCIDVRGGATLSTVSANVDRVGYVQVLSQKNFLALWLGSLTGRTGDYLLSVAMIAFVLKVTGSALDTGLITAAFYIPIFLFAPLFGRIVDNNDRRALMIAASLLEVVLGFFLYFALRMNFMVLPVSFFSVFLISTFGLIVSIGRSSSVPLTVSKDELASANSLQQTTTQLSRIVGYAAGGVLFVLVGEAPGIVLLVVAMFIASAAIFSTMDFVSPIAPGKSRRSADGLRYIAHNRLFRDIAFFLMVVNFTGAGMIFLPAVMSSEVFGTGSTGFALILFVLAAGTMAGNFLVTLLGARDKVGKIMIYSIAANAVLYILFAYAGSLVNALAVTVVIGLVEGVSSVPFVALLQARTPPERMGSVIAGVSMLLLGGASLSMILSGGLVMLLGVRYVYVMFALLLVCMTIVGANMKTLREASY